MAILFYKNTQTFHLQAKDTSYVFQIFKTGYLAHLYRGKRIRNPNLSTVLQSLKRALQKMQGSWE